MSTEPEIAAENASKYAFRGFFPRAQIPPQWAGETPPYIPILTP